MAVVTAEREVGMTEWNDGRLDDLSKRVDRIETKMDAGFAGIDRKFKEVERKMDDSFARLDSKFDELHRMLFKAAWGLAIGLLGLVGLLIGVIVTKV